MKKTITIFVLLFILIIGIFIVKSTLNRDSKEEVISSSDKIETKNIEVSKVTVEKKTHTDETREQDITDRMDNMTLYEKIAQMLIVSPESITGSSKVIQIDESFRESIEELPVGGIIFFDGNIISREQIKEMLLTFNTMSKTPLFLAVDQEGGAVTRLDSDQGFTEFEDMYFYKKEGNDTAYNNAKLIAEELKEIGFNLDFAPVADVWSNSENTVIGTRAYSDDYNEAASLVSSAVNGFHDGGIICTLKHFPGHGNTFEDSHSELAYIDKTKEDLDNGEILPFKAGIKADADMVMIGHLFVTSMDEDNPATFSKTIVTDYLRKELGFDGVIITDSMLMGAVTDNFSSGEASVKSIKAGVDIILLPADVSETISYIENAVESGEISEERINESVERILNLKERYGLYNN